ncbi:Ldh family oxidoreductase [Hydrogenophaga palleronii]|uniref:Ldh family oxidoreductase n=1 Tax=Hydrogenophaga palleronii TaxID=65655 RepID=UPI0008261AA6|nr:Ldh family oxidoreductase [Hydrogenophaga palleronii]
MTLLSRSDLFDTACQALSAAGANDTMARLTATALVEADLQGLASHGVTRIPAYAAHLRNGRANGQAEPRVLRQHGAVLMIDAGQGLAYPACHLAVQQGIELARQQGVAFAVVANSHHFGAAAYHLRPVAEAGLVGLALGNSPAAMPAWGGKRPLFGTNPIAAAFPRAGHDPLLIDLSLSNVARGKLVVAAREGKSIPLGWALDADGQPTTDPQAGLAGSMVPAGGVKGTLLSLVIDLLVGTLTGSHFGFEADSLLDDEGRAPRVGQVFLLIDPAALAGQETYFSRIECLVDVMLEDPNVRLPGAQRFSRQREHEASGVEIPEVLWHKLQQLAAAPGVA